MNVCRKTWKYKSYGILINEEWAQFLSENHFLVGLSLDGPRKIHDQYRRHVQGNSTFEKVMHAVALFEQYGTFLNELFDLWYTDFMNGLQMDIRMFSNLAQVAAGYPAYETFFSHCSQKIERLGKLILEMHGKYRN